MAAGRPSFVAWRAGGYANSASAVPRRADPASLHQLGGETMGTTWSLRFDDPRMLALDAVRDTVEVALARVIAQMSHWQADSVLSRYGAAPAGSMHTLPVEFSSALDCALHWAAASDGAFDPTVGPLVSLWGFGPQGDAGLRQPPDLDQVRRALAESGWQRLRFDRSARLLEQPGGLTLDFSGVAKGFAVDHVVDALQALGLNDLLVEIGGELRGTGRRPDGAPWSVQVAPPDGNSTLKPLTIALRELAIATSGDRWHRRGVEGRTWSHTIDPRTGAPVDHALASVTVLHAECMHADALATVLTVLGPEEGLAFADAHDIAALFYTRGDGLGASMSRAWAERTGA